MSTTGLKMATQIIELAMAHARAAKYSPMAVVVLDASGHLVAAQREDGASMFRIDVALGKAWGAVGMGVPSRVLAERSKENPNFFITLAATAGGKLLPQPGAVLVRAADGTLLGAVGASGGTGDQDEEICAHGVIGVGCRTE